MRRNSIDRLSGNSSSPVISAVTGPIIAQKEPLRWKGQQEIERVIHVRNTYAKAPIQRAKKTRIPYEEATVHTATDQRPARKVTSEATLSRPNVSLACPISIRPMICPSATIAPTTEL